MPTVEEACAGDSCITQPRESSGGALAKSNVCSVGSFPSQRCWLSCCWLASEGGINSTGGGMNLRYVCSPVLETLLHTSVNFPNRGCPGPAHCCWLV